MYTTVFIQDAKHTSKQCLFPLLTRKQACPFFDSTFVSTLLGVGGTLTSLVYNLNKFTFDDIWKASELLLNNMSIDDTKIEDINTTTYFDNNPDELYILLFHAINANFPGVFFPCKDKPKGRFWPRAWGQDRTGYSTLLNKVKFPVHSLSEETTKTYKVAIYYKVSPEEADNWLNIDFLDRQEYMYIQEDVDTQINLIQNPEQN